MKKITITTILGLFLICGLKAQTTMEVPAFTGKIVILRMLETFTSYNSNPWLSITDGTLEKTIEIEKTGPKNLSVNTKLILNIITQVENQGYKLVNTESIGGDVYPLTTYLFRKE